MHRLLSRSVAARWPHGLQHPCCYAFHAGIFVDDIIEAVPIDKYFELFKPNLLGGGGFIRICMNFVKDLSELQPQPGEVARFRRKALQGVQGNPKCNLASRRKELKTGSRLGSIPHTRARAHAHTHTHKHKHTHTYTHMCTHAHTCAHITHMHAYTYTCVHAVVNKS